MLGNQASSDNAACCRMWQIVAGWAFPGQGDSSSTVGRILRQFTLQRAAVDAKELCSLRDVAGTIGQHALDVLPLHPGQRRYRGGHVFLRRVCVEIAVGGQYLFRVGRLAQVMVGSQPQCLHGCGNTSISREYDYGNGGIQLLDGLDHIESAETGHFEVQQDEIGADAAREMESFLRGVSFMGFAIPILECPAEAIPKYRIIVRHEYDEMIAGCLLRTRHASCPEARGLRYIPGRVPIRTITARRASART